MGSYVKARFAGLVIAALVGVPSASALTSGTPAASFTGNFTADSDEREFFFSLAAPGPVVIRTYSYAGGTNGAGSVIPSGGFDPTLSLYDSSGLLLAVNQDGGCGLVARDPVTSSCWDAYLSVTLPAGTYRVVLTQSTNLPAGPMVTDSFIYNPANLFSNSDPDPLSDSPTPPFGGQANFTQPPGSAPGGFWDFFPSQRTSFFAVDIGGASSAVAPSNGPVTTLPPAHLNVAYTPVTLAVNSQTGVTYSWTQPVAGFPPGLSLSPAGVLSGTPTVAGTYTFTATATDGVQTLSQTVTLAVYSSLTITTTALPGGVAGQSYGPVQLAVSGGSGNYTWTSTGLIGLTLSASGVLSGIAPAASFSFTATASDTATGVTASQMFTVVIASPISALSVSSNIQEVAVGTAISTYISVSGGTPPYHFSSPNLPAGLTLGSSSGSLSGTASVAGNFPFSVNVSDSGGQATVFTADLAVLGFTSGNLPSATTGTAYSYTFTAAGGSGVYTFTAMNLPAGLSLSKSGALTGTPVTSGTPQFTVQVTDGLVTASMTVTLTIAAGTISPLSTPGGSLTTGQAQASYTATLAASGGVAPYSWILLGGSLPPGLALASNGSIGGIPTLAGSFSFTLQTTDSTGTMVSASYTIVIAPAPLTLTTGNSLPNGVVGAAYPLQIFTATGGVLPYTFSLASGALPPGLSLGSAEISGTPTATGTFPFTLSVTDAANTSVSLSLSIIINLAQADLILSDTFLTFSLMQGATALPAGDNVTVRSSVVQQLLNYSYSLTPAVPWLSVNGGASTPGTLAVSLNSSALSQSPSTTPYSTNLNVTCLSPSPCAGHTQSVSISLNVTAPPTQLTLTSSVLSFSATTSNPVSSSLPLGVENSGGGSLGISSITAADPWVTVSGIPGSIAAGGVVPVTITVNPSGLPAGYNSSSVTVVSSAGSQTVPVTLNISSTTTLTLSPASAPFSLPAGSTLSPSSGTFQVSVSGSQPVSWNASVLPGAAFLSTSTPSGSSTASNAGTVSYSIDPVVAATLPAGTYYGTIRVTSAAVTNSPQDFQVVVQVAAATSLPVPVPQPAGLLFQTGAAPSQAVSVYTSSTTSVNYQASASTTDGANWLAVSPATGAASAVTPGASSVSINAAGLAPGVYTGLVNYALSAAVVKSVNVTLIVTGASGSAQTSGGALAALPLATSCAPSQLVATQVALPSNFSVVAALPQPLKTLITDNCGNAIPNAQVSVTFSNGDPPLTLTPVDTVSGFYTGTWVPLTDSPQVTVATRATAAGLTAGTSKVNGQVKVQAGPLINPNAVLSVYDPLIGGAVSPGAILQIYGSALAAAAVTSSQVPLTTTLGSTSVTVGGIPAPLYYVSPTQINAQAPFELVPGNQYQVVISNAGALTAPATISVAAAEPGIAGYQNGQIIAQHLDGTLISESSPAKPGTYVVFYLAGLGATDTPVADGAGSPFTPLAHPVIQPVLTLNGVSQPYQFVGLTPGIVGLYQINFLVPANTANGDMLLGISQAGVRSNTVILPVHQ